MRICFKVVFQIHRLEMAELTLEQETALKVRDLQVRFDEFETQNSLNDCVISEIDEELEQSKVDLKELEKRVRELEKKERVADLTEEKTAALDAQNIELRDHLNATVDTLNAVVKIINDQIIARQPADGPNPDFDDGVDRHHYLEEVNELTQEEWNDLLQM